MYNLPLGNKMVCYQVRNLHLEQNQSVQHWNPFTQYKYIYIEIPRPGFYMS